MLPWFCASIVSTCSFLKQRCTTFAAWHRKMSAWGICFNPGCAVERMLWKRCGTQGEGVVPRCQLCSLHAEEGRVDGSPICNLRKICWQIAFSKKAVKQWHNFCEDQQDVATYVLSMGALQVRWWRNSEGIFDPYEFGNDIPLCDFGSV